MPVLFKYWTVLICCSFLIVASGLPLQADEISDSINDGLTAYNNGELSEAFSSISYASQLIQQKRGETLKALLPDPLESWEGKDASSNANAATGVSASRQYNKGSSRVTVQIHVDSPMLQGVMMMFTNPMYASSSGGKLEKINGEKAMLTFNEDRQKGNIKLVIGNRYYISVEGRDVTPEDLRGYAQAMDFKKLAGMQ